MSPTWQDYLNTAGASIEEGMVRHFGNPRDEVQSTRNGTILTDLSHLGVIRFSGADSESFLQGQLSCDVRLATAAQAQPGSYCTPQGRMLATFLLWRTEEGFLMQLPQELCAPIQKRLRMYVLRAKVTIAEVSDATVRLGLAGEHAAAAIAELGVQAPEQDYGMAQGMVVNVIRLPGGRFEVVLAPESAPAAWQSLVRQGTPVGADRWQWLEIRQGIPTVTAGTQEQLVPQMANLELIGGVSFKKGCYTGQEVVARSQYLGKVKRRMFLVHVESALAPKPGDKLFGLGPEEQSAGLIVNAQTAPDGGYDALAVILSTAMEAGDVHWNSPDGPILSVLTLPYAVE